MGKVIAGKDEIDRNVNANKIYCFINDNYEYLMNYWSMISSKHKNAKLGN